MSHLNLEKNAENRGRESGGRSPAAKPTRERRIGTDASLIIGVVAVKILLLSGVALAVSGIIGATDHAGTQGNTDPAGHSQPTDVLTSPLI
jgi:hypothetical protein